MSQIKNKLSTTDRRHFRRARCIALLACVAVVPVLATSTIPAGAAIKPAPGRHKCTPPKLAGQRSLDLTVFKISCATGRSLSIKQYKCRKAHSKTNICPEKPRINGYKCREQRLFNKGSYDGRVACIRGSFASVYIYRQKR